MADRNWGDQPLNDTQQEIAPQALQLPSRQTSSTSGPSIMRGGGHGGIEAVFYHPVSVPVWP